MDVLDQLRIGENTLVLVTSENGSLLGSLKFCKPEGTAKITNGHKSMGSWCGKKRRGWEGYHRVPFVARRPGKITPNTTSEYAFYFNDLLATFADLLDADLPEESGEDSFTLLPALLGQPTDYRPPIINHSNSNYALHSRNWKIVFG